MTDFQLSDHEKTQGIWLRLRDHLTTRLADARKRNDAPLTADETAALRGEIKTLKAIIRLGDDRPVMLTGAEEQPPA